MTSASSEGVRPSQRERLLGRHRFHCPILYNPTHPPLIAISVPTATIAHKITPCNKGLGPTSFNVFLDNPVPIKNNVTVNPILPSLLSTTYPGPSAGKYVLATAARQKNNMNHGH
jgi:hypothetical protein